MIDGPAPTGYPIVNYEYAVVSTRQPNAAKASALKAFLHWVITTGNGPSYLDAVGFQPLPRRPRDAGRAADRGDRLMTATLPAAPEPPPPRRPAAPGRPRPRAGRAAVALHTPATLRALLAGLVLLSLAWGAFGGWVATAALLGRRLAGHA